MKVRVLWTGDVIDLCVPRSPFGALECSQGNNLEIRSSTGAEALRDEQWRDEAWVRLNHAGKCSERKRASTPLSVAHQSFPVTSQVCNCNKHHACFWGIILTCLDRATFKKQICVFTAEEKTVEIQKPYITVGTSGGLWKPLTVFIHTCSCALDL